MKWIIASLMAIFASAPAANAMASGDPQWYRQYCMVEDVAAVSGGANLYLKKNLDNAVLRIEAPPPNYPDVVCSVWYGYVDTLPGSAPSTPPDYLFVPFGKQVWLRKDIHNGCNLTVEDSSGLTQLRLTGGAAGGYGPKPFDVTLPARQVPAQ